MSASDDGLEVLLAGEVAAMLRIPVDTLATWRKRRVGPRFFKVGRSVRYERAAVQAWIDEGGRTDEVTAQPVEPAAVS